MAVNRCPSCSSQVLPGEVNCRRCGYDFILGKKPEDWNPIDQARRQRTFILSAAAAVLVIVGASVVLFLAPGGDEDQGVSDPCLVALAAMQPVVVSALDRGNPVPTCEPTPPGPADCWTRVGVKIAQHAQDGLAFSLRPGSSGFEMQCLVDADGNGEHAIYKANAVIDGVKISGSEVL